MPDLSSLTTLFTPESVAIIGASDDPDRLSGRPVRYLLEGGYAGAIYPINPNRRTVQGLTSYPSMRAIPRPPDAVLVIVPAALALQAVADSVAAGARGIYLLTGGFSEIGEDGERIQNEIGRIARAANVRILGPNCLGAFNSRSRFFGAFGTSLERGLPAPGPVAIVSQSGAYGQHLAYLVRRRGLGVSYFVSTGNEIDVEMSECIEWMTTRGDVRVILVYAEGIRNGARLKAALEAARVARKAVVFMKVGVSDVGARAVRSHTAALAGSDDVIDGVLRQFGAYRAHSVEEQLDIGYACALAQPIVGSRLGIVSVSGGGGVHMADCAAAHGLDVAPIPQGAAGKLHAISPMGGSSNPIDVTGQVVNDPQMFRRSLEVVAGECDYDALAVFLTTVPLTSAGDAPLREAIEETTREFRRKGVVVVSAVAAEASVEAYEAQGILVHEDPARAIRAVVALRHFGTAFSVTRAGDPASRGDPPGLRLPSRPLSEVEAKQLLQRAGIASLPESLAASESAAIAAAARYDAPVAMKIVSADILHKTEIGGVVLNVLGAPAVGDAYRTIVQRARDAHPEAEIAGVLVTPMAPRGVEVILGAVNDAAFGPMVMFGLGGVQAECFHDVAFRAAPFDLAEAHRMIAETRAARLLAGWRGAPAADVDAIAQALCALSGLAASLGDQLDSIDVNPFLVLPKGQGAVALDAVIVGRPAAPSPDVPSHPPIAHP